MLFVHGTFEGKTVVRGTLYVHTGLIEPVSRKEVGAELSLEPVPTEPLKGSRTHLKKVFWPKLGVGRSLQVLEILKYSSGLDLATALILNQNPLFEIGSH
jgi:hypothetical protein